MRSAILDEGPRSWLVPGAVLSQGLLGKIGEPFPWASSRLFLGVWPSGISMSVSTRDLTLESGVFGVLNMMLKGLCVTHVSYALEISWFPALSYNLAY